MHFDSSTSPEPTRFRGGSTACDRARSPGRLPTAPVERVP